jgi:hypothetical protein
MSIFAKFKTSVAAPKTADAQYDEAAAALKLYTIEANPYASALGRLTKSLGDLCAASRKCTNDVSTWLTDDTPPELASRTREVNSFAVSFERITQEILTLKIDPSFLQPFAQYEAAVADLRKLRHARDDARVAFDKAREWQRVLESQKKQKKPDIDKAQAKATESQEKYESLNAQFIEAVREFGERRRATLGMAFRHLVAILCRYIRAIGPGGGDALPVVEKRTEPVSRPPPEQEAEPSKPQEEAAPAEPAEPEPPAPEKSAPVEPEPPTKVQPEPAPPDDQDYMMFAWPPSPKDDEPKPPEKPAAPDAFGDPFGDVDGWGADPFAGQDQGAGAPGYDNPFDGAAKNPFDED